MRRRLASWTLAAAQLLSACGFDSKLDSDPGYWLPTETAGVADGSADAIEPPIPGCDVEPPFSAELRASAEGGASHLAGKPCLESCHEAGGTAQKIFSAAGTIYRSQGSRAVTRTGQVQGVGGTTLNVDRCGNFYATSDALVTGVDRTQPFVQQSALHRMDKSLYRVPKAGSCNQATCHDFSSRQRWGIFF